MYTLHVLPNTRTLWMALSITLALGVASLMWVIGEQAAQDRAYQYRLNGLFQVSQQEHHDKVEAQAMRLWAEMENDRLGKLVIEAAKHRKPL